MTPVRAAVSLGLATVAVLGAAVMVLAVAREPPPIEIDIAIHYSHYQPAAIVVAGGPADHVRDRQHRPDRP